MQLSQADELDGSLTPSRGKASATPLYPEVNYSFEITLVLIALDTNL